MGKIIVVEDNLVFSGYVCGMLESKGYRHRRAGADPKAPCHLPRYWQTVSVPPCSRRHRRYYMKRYIRMKYRKRN